MHFLSQPFHPVVLYADSRGRGVVGKNLYSSALSRESEFYLTKINSFVGVLETNFIEPTHNKQDFEKTSVYQKLVTRLKEMTWEYW